MRVPVYVGGVVLVVAAVALLYSRPIRPVQAAIFSLISSDNAWYVYQLRLLEQSLRQFAPGHTLHVVITDDVSAVVVSEIRAFATVRVIPAYAEPDRPMMYTRWIHQFTKFKLWSFYEFERICYMDADVSFLGTDTLQSIVSECARSLEQVGVELCGFESDCQHNGAEDGRGFWGMRYMQANFFCLRPNATLFADIERNVVGPFLHRNFTFAGRKVSTEQDVMNLYFKNRIHYASCDYVADGLFLHGKSENGRVEWEMVNGLF